jgi:glycosyltransferase involved in cell wall biosynthesis
MKYDGRKILISIGMITCRRADLLKESLEAILPQSRPEVELIVLVDGEDTQTLEVLKSYNTANLQVYVNQTTQGRPASRNTVIRYARGEYILWVDDDDLSMPDLVSTYLELIRKHADIDVAYCDLEIRDTLRGGRRHTLSAENTGGCGARILQNLIENKGITSGGSIVRKSLYVRLGGFDERMLKAQDNEFWYRAALHARFHQVNKTLYIYRIHGRSGSVSWKSDPSYPSFALRNALKHIPLEQIYPDYNWSDAGAAIHKALSVIAYGLSLHKDYYNASRFLMYIPVECLSAKDAVSLIRFSLIQGDARKVFSAYKRLQASGSVSPSVTDSCKSLILKIHSLESSITRAYQIKDHSMLRDHIREYQQKLDSSFFVRSMLAKRFIDISDFRKAYRSYYYAFMLQPENRELYEWLKKHEHLADTSMSAQALRERIAGTAPHEPDYILASQRSFALSTHFFSDVRSIFNRQMVRV